MIYSKIIWFPYYVNLKYIPEQEPRNSCLLHQEAMDAP